MGETPTPGQIFDERYEVLDIVGAGGLGTVFKARQLDLNRIIALKVVFQEFWQDEEFRIRFQREAQTLSKIAHPNIVTIYHLGVSATGQGYLAMELVEGKSLRQLLNEIGRFPAGRALRIIRDAALALQYVHDNEIVHRDLKPDNILLVSDGGSDLVKIIDFGLARLTDSASQQLTKTGMLVGTANYMSPEQCKGSKADGRSDIYSLAACLYELLTGKRCFDADTAIGIMYKHINETPIQLSSLSVDGFSPQLPALLSKALEKDPAQRYQKMSDFAQAIDLVIDSLEKDGIPRNNSPLIVAMLVLTAVSICGILAFSIYRQNVKAAKVSIKIDHPSSFEKKGVDKKNLDSPESVRLPMHAEELRRLVDLHSEHSSADAQLIILKRWEQLRGGSATSSDTIPVNALFARAYSRSGKIKHAETYANKVFAHQSATESISAAGSDLADAYRKHDDPRKGLALIEKLQTQNPGILDTYFGVALLNEEALCYEDLADFPKAEKLLWQVNEICKKRPGAPREDDNPLRFNLVSLLAREGKTQQMQKVISESILAAQLSRPMAADEASARAYSDIAQELSRVGQDESSMKYWEAALEIFSRLKESKKIHACLTNLGQLKHEQKHYGEALSYMKRSLTVANKLELPANLLSVAENEEALHDNSSAIDFAKQAIKASAQRIDGWKGDHNSNEFVSQVHVIADAIRVLKAVGDNSEELNTEWIAKIEKIAPNNKGLLTLYEESIYYLNARGQRPEAIKVANAAISNIFSRISDPSKPSPENKKELARFYIFKAEILKASSKEKEQLYDMAKKGMVCLDTDSLSTPERISLYVRFGKIFSLLKKQPEADYCFTAVEPIIRKAIKNGEKFGPGWLRTLADARAQQPNEKEAVRLILDCKSILEKQNKANSTEMTSTLFVYGDIINVCMHDRSRAEAMLQKALLCSAGKPKTSDYAAVLHYLSAMTCDAGEFKKAQNYARQYIEVCAPKNLRFGYFDLATAYAKDNHPQLAISTLKNAIERKDKRRDFEFIDRSFLHRHLGMIYSQLDSNKAEKEYIASLEEAQKLNGYVKESELALTNAQLGKLKLALGRYDEGSALIKSAIPMLQQRELGDELRSVASAWLKAAEKINRTADIMESKKLLQEYAI